MGPGRQGRRRDERGKNPASRYVPMDQVRALKLKVVCGEQDCRNEFSADTDEPEWECPACQHLIKNPHFPFLTARIMHSRARPDDVDWEEFFARLMEDVSGYFTERADFLFNSKDGERVREELGEEAVAFIRMSMDGGDELAREYGERHNGEWHRMHESLLEEAREIAQKVWALQRSLGES